MENTVIKDDDVYWEYFNAPSKEIIFDNNQALARLLANEVVFVNNYWWKTAWPDAAKRIISVNVICNDIFAWGAADVEPLEYKELQDLYDHWCKDQDFGPAVWCIKKRKELPQKPVYNSIQASGIWDLDKMDLKPNSYDKNIANLKSS